MKTRSNETGTNPLTSPLPKGESEVIEPEVLPSLDALDASAQGQPGPIRPLGCTVGPGCGCIGLPLALIAGAIASALLAVLWVLSLGRVPVSIVQLIQRLRRGRGQG